MGSWTLDVPLLAPGMGAFPLVSLIFAGFFPLLNRMGFVEEMDSAV